MQTVTYELSDFGARERGMMVDLLQAWERQGLPECFYEDGVRVGFNMNSGYVWLENSEGQAAMLNGDRLELFITLSSSGREGFAEELVECQDDLDSDDIDQLEGLLLYCPDQPEYRRCDSCGRIVPVACKGGCHQCADSLTVEADPTASDLRL